MKQFYKVSELFLSVPCELSLTTEKRLIKFKTSAIAEVSLRSDISSLGDLV